jgi:hypothetical protein
MKQLIVFPFLIAGVMPSETLAPKQTQSINALYIPDKPEQGFNIQAPQQEGSTKMRTAVFKAQEYCRADLKDFEFDIQYKVVGAVVYFSGANFTNIAKGTITSNSLKPIKLLMEKCVPGTIVIFDEVKVVGPDNAIRTIPGVSLVLN